MKKFILNTLSENGNISSIRINLFIGTIYIGIIIILICFLVVTNKDINYIYALTGLITVIGGIYFGSKIIQKKFENNNLKDDVMIGINNGVNNVDEKTNNVNNNIN